LLLVALLLVLVPNDSLMLGVPGMLGIPVREKTSPELEQRCGWLRLRGQEDATSRASTPECRRIPNRQQSLDSMEQEHVEPEKGKQDTKTE